MLPRATYDSEARVIVIDVRDGAVAGTVAFPDDDHLVDVDADGQVIGIEILTPAALKLDQIASRFGLEELPLRMVAMQAMVPRTAVSAHTAVGLAPIEATVTTVSLAATAGSRNASEPREIHLING